jgi:phosphoglycolate phosphatase
MTTDYKGVIFDLDGTLLYTIEDLIDACNHVMKKHNFPTYTYENGKKLIGRGIVNLIRDALPVDKREEEFVTDCVNDFISYYEKHMTDKTRPYDGIPDLLDTLAENDIPCAVHTNKPQNAASRVAKLLLPGCNFIDVVGYHSEETRKPNPSDTLAIIEKMSLHPSEVLFIGDSVVDLYTGNNAKAVPVLVTWGYSTFQELRKAGGKLFVNSPDDILDFFDL